MVINVAVALSNDLFAEGVARLLADEGDIKVTPLNNGYAFNEQDIESADVILTDFATLYAAFPHAEPSKRHRLILIDTDCGRDNIISAIMAKHLSGVLLGHATVPVMIRAVRSVAMGDIWMDKATVKNLLWGANRLKREKSEVLSPREKEVVALAGTGLRNREIAQKLNISELTIKTHLHRIFKKLEINTRSQLITYSIRNTAVKDALFGKQKA